MRDAIWNKRLPTLLGISIIAVGIIATSLLVQTGSPLFVRANPLHAPKEIKVTNISDTSFTVTYITEETTIGSVSYGRQGPLAETAIDERDQKTKRVRAYKLHHIRVENLTPITKYLFFLMNGDGSPFEVTTASPQVALTSARAILRGKVLNLDGSPPQEAIVYLSGKGQTTILSSLVNPDGSWEIPVEQVDKSTVLELSILSDTDRSSAIIPASQLVVPTMLLSKDYDFGASVFPSASPSASLFLSLGTATKSAQTIKLLTPKEGERLPPGQLLFRGTAPPNTAITITVESTEQITAQVKADSLGFWTYQPKTQLTKGAHTLTVTAQDHLGILRTITRSFTVEAAIPPPAKSDLAPASTATPIPTPTSTPTPPPAQPVTKGQLPPPGNTTLLIVLLAGTAAIGIPLVILFLARRSL